jgi:putative transposase
VSGYTPGTPLCLCQECHMRGNADRNASLVIGQRLMKRYERSPLKEKPHALARRAQGVEQSTGVVLSQDAKREEKPSFSQARPGEDNGHGTAQEDTLRMDGRSSDIPTQLRLFNE